ncbi:Protein RcaC [Hyella patelloides LEGE 07179]|uniref:Protein RcaC n=1 Tax=Hyella patelloides LEGE 07179 TaxID=945734 RepID=A0A563VL16_9CYAN|nr:response regulator [Hyella patelloides]VEP12144.1 Protein RcaC [Hyella patelloides LEGE 07179]
MRILLVDDDETLVDILTRTLAEWNYAIDVVTDGEQGWVYGSTYTYDLIILDWSLPKLDGISLCQRFRTNGYSIPIILLTSRHGSQNKIRGLDAGADDYICKPFDIEELAARIRALLRRINFDFLPILGWGDLKLDPCSCTVTYQEQPLSLSTKEYSLLELFLRHSPVVLSIEEIIENLWSSAEYPSEATVRSHLRNLRQKLTLAGLPEDLISNIRGQGYCLKYPEPDLTETQTSVALEPQIDKRSQHLAMLTSAWEKYRQKSEQQLLTLEKAVQSLLVGNLSVSDRVSAIVSAHSLAGNLGLFGFERGSQLARKLEQLLQSNTHQETATWLQLSHNLQSLSQEIKNNQHLYRQISQKISENQPLLLIIDDDSDFVENLTKEAVDRGINTKILPNPQLVRRWLAEQQASNQQLPDAVLIKISFTEDTSIPSSRQEYLALVAEFNLLVPSIPVIVIADLDLFKARLQVARHGGRFYLAQPVSPSQTITVCQKALQHSSLGKKVMVVDDDIELLQALPVLLEPWGFKLTTLDNPRQFWDVLQAVAPDLLVLDIEMPYLSGIELCKVLRTHNYWCKIPILFLSVHSDSTISNQAFASGANDFVNKPVVPKQLAHRIINHLNLRR